MGGWSEKEKKKGGLKSNKSHLDGWWKLARLSVYATQITPFVRGDILIQPDLKLPMNQRLNKRPPTVFAVNLLSPFWAPDRDS